MGMVDARPVFVQPTNWLQLKPSTSATDFKDSQINNAINNLRQNGGGTVYLPAGTYYLSRPIIIETQGTLDAQSNPFHVRVLGARPITSHNTAAGETKGVAAINPPVAIDQGPNKGKKVVYLRDADGVTLEFIGK